jgi:hypothetical protein
LDKHGYVVISGVLSDSEVKNTLTQVGEDFAKLGTGINPDLKTEPTNKQLPSMFSYGILKDKNAGLHQSKSAWICRKKAEPIFRAMYQTEQVITSFDGMTFFST